MQTPRIRRRFALPLVLAATAAAQTTAGDPVLGRLPRDATSVLIVQDLLPVIESVMRSEQLATLAEATAPLQQELFGREFHPKALAPMLNLFADYVPRQLVVAAPPDTMQLCAEALAATVAAVVLPQLQADAPEQADELHALIARVVASARAPTLSGWVRARSERVAGRWFDAVLDGLEALPPDGLSVRTGDDHVEVDVWLARASSNLRTLMQRLQIDLGPLAELNFTLRLEIAGDTLRLRVGPSAPTPLAAAELGPLWQAAPDRLLFAHLDLRPALDWLDTSTDIIEQALAALPDDGANATMVQVQELWNRVYDVAPRLAASIEVRDGLRSTIEYYFEDEDELAVEPASTLLLHCIDPAAGPLQLSSQPLDGLLYLTYSEIVSRVGSRADRPGQLQLYNLLIEQGGDLLDFLAGEDSAVFAPGCAMTARGSRLRAIALPGLGTLRDLPLVSVAMVAIADSAAAGAGFVDRLTRHLATTFDASTDVTWQNADLGLGVTTRTLPWQQWLPPGTGLELDADFVLHHVQRGDLMILSTDPALTRDLLARLDAGEAVALPIADPVDWRRISGEQLAALCTGAATWIAAANGGLGDDRLVKVATVMRALATIAEEVDVAESYMSVDGTTVRDVQHLGLRSRAK